MVESASERASTTLTNGQPERPRGFAAPQLRLTGYFGAPAELPARQAAELKAFLDSSQVAEINAAEFAATPATDDQLRAVSSLGNRPLFVLSATEHGQSKQQERQWQIWQRDLTSLSTDSVQEVVDGASHVSLQFDETHAQTTSAAIQRVVEAVRARRPLTSDADHLQVVPSI